MRINNKYFQLETEKALALQKAMYEKCSTQGHKHFSKKASFELQFETTKYVYAINCFTCEQILL